MSKLILFFLLALLSSCLVENAVRGSDRMCKLHHTRMHKTLVRTCFGYAAYEHSDSPHAKREENLGCVRPLWPNRRMALIYHCPVCDGIKKAKGNKNDY
jgi:hypothetical protein